MNPYLPPTATYGAPVVQDSGDLFVQTLPPPALRAAGFCAIVTGILMLFMCFRFVLNGVTGTFVTISELVLIVGGILEFIVAWGVTGGRVSTWILGLVLTPVLALMSLVTLLTGSIAGLFGGTLVIVNVTLLAASFGAVRRIGEARAALARQLTE